MQRYHLMAIKWKDIRDVYFLTSAHENVPVDAPLSRGAQHKIKPAAVWTTTSIKMVWTDQTRCCHIICLKGRQ